MLQAKRSEGGLGLVNLELKDDSLKASWINFIESDSFVMETSYHKLNVIPLNKQIWKCNIDKKDVLKQFETGFWKDVLSAWAKWHFKENCLDENILDQIIWFNSHIKVNKKTVFYRKALKAGLLCMGQLIDINTSEVISVNILSQWFEMTVMECNSLVTAIPSEWKKYIKETGTRNLECSGTDKKLEIFKIKQHVASFYYKELNYDHSLLQCAF